MLTDCLTLFAAVFGCLALSTAGIKLGEWLARWRGGEDDAAELLEAKDT